MTTFADAFNPQGNTITFLAATSAPSPVQVLGDSTSAPQYRVVNAGSSLVFLGYGRSAAQATAAAIVVATSGAAMPLLPGTVEVFTIIPNTWFTGITASGTSQVYITPGLGS